MKNLRIEKSSEMSAYERIVKRQKEKIRRKNLSEKEYLEGNLAAKRGMRLLRSEGRLRKFANRETGKKDELFQWKQYMQKSEKHREILSKNQPDIVSKINENARLEKERERLTEENRKKGE